MNVYPFIEAEKSQRRNVKRACVLLKVSRSAFYTDRTAGPSQRERDDAELTDAIVAVYDESDGTYGARRAGRPGPTSRPQAHRPAHARRWPSRSGTEAVAHHDRARPDRRCPGGPDRAGLRNRHHGAGRPLVRRHHGRAPRGPRRGGARPRPARSPANQRSTPAT